MTALRRELEELRQFRGQYSACVCVAMHETRCKSSCCRAVGEDGTHDRGCQFGVERSREVQRRPHTKRRNVGQPNRFNPHDSSRVSVRFQRAIGEVSHAGPPKLVLISSSQGSARQFWSHPPRTHGSLRGCGADPMGEWSGVFASV